MENVIAPENTPPLIETQTGTSSGAAVQAEDQAAELARLKQERIDLEKRLTEKDKYINDLSTEKATLENRLSGYQAVGSVEESSQVATEGQDVRNYVRPEDIPEIIERTSFISKMKQDNSDLMDLGFEPVISFRADQLIRSGKSFKEAVATAVKEQREKINKIKAPVTKSEEPVSSSVRGEGGANPPVEAKPKAEETLGDEGEERKRLRAKRGL